MSTGQTVFIAHRVPGRVRLVVEPIRRDPPRAERVADRARAAPWVTGARASPFAASLVVEHDPAVPLERVLGGLAQIPELEACGTRRIEELERAPGIPAGAPPHPGRTARLVLRAAARVNSASTALAAPHADLKILIPGAFFSYGLYLFMTSRAARMPGWLAFFKYGLDTFVVLNQGAVRGFLQGAPAPEAGARP